MFYFFKGDKMDYQSLMQDELARSMLNTQQEMNKAKIGMVENPIGEMVYKKWNANTLKDKYPFAPLIEKEFNKMLKEVIPEGTVLSSRMDSWITKERNHLMVDSRINQNHYFKKNIDFETGETSQNNQIEIVEKKLELLKKEINSFRKALETTKTQKPEIFYPSQEELNKWGEYYQKRLDEIKNLKEEQKALYKDEVDIQKHMAQLEKKIADVKEQQQQVSGTETQTEIQVLQQDIPLYTHKKRS